MIYNQPKGVKGKLQAKRLNETAILPTRANANDAGLDLYALSDVFIPVGGSVRVPTGIAFNVPSGTYIQIADRSSLAVKGLRTGAGVVDTGYQGDVSVVLHNLNNTSSGYYDFDSTNSYNTFQKGYKIKKGDKIAQAILIPILTPELEEVTEFAPSERGDRGFGSSGR